MVSNESKKKIVFSSNVSIKIPTEELALVRVKALTESEIDTSAGKVLVVERNFVGQEVRFVTFPDEVDTPLVKISVSPTAEKLNPNLIEEMVGHTIALSANKSQETPLAVCQEYKTPSGHFHTFAEIDPNGGIPIVYVGLASEIATVQKDFQMRNKGIGRTVKIYTSPKSRADSRRRKLKAEKRALKKSRTNNSK